jgi:hypothetical protein
VKRLPLDTLLGGNPLENVSEVGNPLVNLVEGARVYWQPTDKYITGFQELLATLSETEGIGNLE